MQKPRPPLTVTIDATCALCAKPIHNRADEGRPDLWTHTNPSDDNACLSATAPYTVEGQQPKEKRLLTICVTETNTYIITKEVEIHVGVTDEELPAYLADNEDLWLDDINDTTWFRSDDREIDPDETGFVGDWEYLEFVKLALKHWPTSGPDITRWLTKTCPACKEEPIEGDTKHSRVNGYVAIDCTGRWVINPNAVGLESTTWQDWTEQPAHA